MAKQTFENKMLNSIYETNGSRMQFLLDNKALTFEVISYIEKHMRFVSTRCVDNEKQWKVLSNFSDFLELKRVFEQIKEKEESGDTTNLLELKERFETIKKKFAVTDTENVLRAKKDETEWGEFLNYFVLTSSVDEKLGSCEKTNLLPSSISKWTSISNPTAEQLLGLIAETSSAYLTDNGFNEFKVKVVDGSGVRPVIGEQTIYVGEEMINMAHTTKDSFDILSKVLMAGELVSVTAELNKPLKNLSPLKQAISYERAMSIVTAIRNDRLISNSPQLNNLLLFNSAKLIKQYCGEIGEQYFKTVMQTIPQVKFTQNVPSRIVEEYYESHLGKIENLVNGLISKSKKEASLIK